MPGQRRPRKPALELFSHDLLQHFLVQAKIGDKPLQAGVFLFKLLQSAQFAHPKPAKFALSVVEGGFRDPHLATDLGYPRSRLRLLQRKGNLLIRES